MFTSGYINMETILHFFYKITNERGTKTAFTYAHVRCFFGRSERAYYLNYFINQCVTLSIAVHTGGPAKNDVWLVATQKKDFENT